MQKSECEQLEGYLDGELAPFVALSFARHLDTCAACREAVALDKQLDGLLAQVRPQAPRGLTARIARSAPVDRVRPAALRTGLIAAAVGLLALGLWWSTRNEAAFSNLPTDGDTIAEDKMESQPVQISFASDAKVIAVPVKTKNPGVTVVWVYPQLRVADAAPSEPSGPN